jgi:hypothetical protein
MISSKDIAAALVALVILTFVVVQRHSSKRNRGDLYATPPPASVKSRIENDVNKDRRPGGEYHSQLKARLRTNTSHTALTYHRLDTRRFCLSYSDTRC